MSNLLNLNKNLNEEDEVFQLDRIPDGSGNTMFSIICQQVHL